MKTIRLNNKEMFNLVIFNNSIRYTRHIDNKLQTIDVHCDDANEVLEKLSALTNMDDDMFMKVLELTKNIEKGENIDG